MGLFGSSKRKERENAKDAQIAALQKQLDTARAKASSTKPPRPPRDAGEVDRLKNVVRRLNSTVVKKDSELRDAEFSRLHYNEIQKRLGTVEDLLSQKEKKIAALEKQLQEKVSSPARVTQQPQERRSSKTRELEVLNREYKSVKKELDRKNEAVEMLRSEVDTLVHELETYKNLSMREKERLEATEALLSQREGRIAELESEIQENTDMVANTRLLLNQSRNEVNNEKRRARLAAEAVADKNRKMEFLQQECARLYVSRGGGDVNTERRTRREESRMRG